MDLVERFVAHVNNNGLFDRGHTLLLAVSGGVDSVVLCELCRQAAFSFVIAHMNFGLRGAESDADEQWVRELAEQYKTEVRIRRVDTLAYADQHNVSVQVAARELRYNWFQELLRQGFGSRLLTAHHADDNLETVLMNFFRGTGINGLAGIPDRQEALIRPLLPFSKQEILEFARMRGLRWREDLSNQSDKYTRNYFRNVLIPLVEKVYPEAANNILRNIPRLKEAGQLYRQAVDAHLKKMVEPKGEEQHVPVLKLRRSEPLATIVFEWIRPYGFHAAQLPDVLGLLGEDAQGKYVQSVSHRLIRNRNWLILAPVGASKAGHILIEEGAPSVFWEDQVLTCKVLPAGEADLAAGGGSTACLDTAVLRYPLILRKWKPGDYFYPLGMTKKKKLSRFFIDQKLSVTQKEKTWVLESDKRICWVVGMRIDHRFRVREGSRMVLMLSLGHPR